MPKRGGTRKFALTAATAAVFACGVSAAPGAAPAIPSPGDEGSWGARSGTAVARDCAGDLLPTGSPGAARSSLRAAAEGLLSVRLDAGPAPDWDLALFSGGEPVAASTSFGSRELATVAVEPGQRIVVQACRRAGGRAEARLTAQLFETAGLDPAPERISLESVAITGPEDVSRLEELGADVTHDVSPHEAVVLVSGQGERALLSRAGFEPEPVIRDLPAADAEAREREARAELAPRVSPLPTGRESYRVYEDYTTELKDLAEQNPAIVRPLRDGGGNPGVGGTIEGRRIEGIEIAADVHRTDDGRPVYLNMGTHHAREWPSGEFPMEFAHTLVDGFNASDPRIVSLLADVRVMIIPVVNADGFIASRSFGTSPLDDDSNATLPQSLANQAAYIRKNCRATDPAQAATPCALRTGSGIDLNRNYGYYWGGPGSTSDTTSQSYRGTGPFSEPESQAVHALSSRIHPTVLITNHTFTDTGWWLRQPGFDGAFLPQGPDGAITPDEPAMAALGDAMGDATQWPSDLGWELGDITGATEDWNYFAQGTYGYTPEARGPNFHANYDQMVVDEYVGLSNDPNDGVREAFLVAGEEAADPDDHGVIQGTVPPGATLTLRKQFEAPTFSQPALNVDEELETTMTGPASGSYEWHVMPSDRPQVSGGPAPNPGDEEWTMTCQRPGGSVFTDTVEVARGQAVTVDWGSACGADAPGNVPPVAGFDRFPSAPAPGEQVNLTSTSTDPDGAIAATAWDLDDDGGFDDAAGLVATRTFPSAGSYEVSVEVTDDEGATDTHTETIVVGSSSNSVPAASFVNTPAKPDAGEPIVFRSTSTDSDGEIEDLAWDFDADGQFDDARGGQTVRTFADPGVFPVSLRATDDDGGSGVSTRNVVVGKVPACAGRRATILGTKARDVINGTPGRDTIVALGGRDRVRGGGGKDFICGGPGGDLLRGGRGKDLLRGGKGRDRLFGGPGRDGCAGGAGRDRVRGCA